MTAQDPGYTNSPQRQVGMEQDEKNNIDKQRAIMCRGGWFSRRDFIKGAGAAAAGVPIAMATSGLTGGLMDFSELDLAADDASAGGPNGNGFKRALVLYDGTGEFAWIGNVHAKQLANLIGRFLPTGARANNTVIKTVAEYTAGEMNQSQYTATFYLGQTYDNQLPTALRNDILATRKPFVFFKYNLWQIAWTPDFSADNATFVERFGFRWEGLHPGAGSTFSRVSYKGAEFAKSLLDAELGVTRVINAGQATVKAWSVDANNNEVPYIIHGRPANAIGPNGGLWYVADSPFSYMSEEDRYMVFSDVLFDMVGVTHAQTRRGLVRLEDVSAISNPAQLRACADYLSGRNAPFSIATIPIYNDPLGTWNGGVAERIPISRAATVKSAINYMRGRGGEVIMHGTTHQYQDVPNPYTGVSADDFEFFRVTENPDLSLTFHGPVPEDSRQWARGLLNNGIRELRRAGWGTPTTFEAPHYGMSEVDYLAVGGMFDWTYHRVLYFQDQSFVAERHAPTPGTTRQAEEGRRRRRERRIGNRNAGAAGGAGRAGAGTPGRGGNGGGGNGGAERAQAQAEPDKFAGQFFPYVIQRDVYRNKLLPENLNNIEPTGWPDPVEGPYMPRLPEALVRDATRNRVLRDAWASFYFHPFFDLSYLRETIEGIQDAGYEFQRASSVRS
ncbi:MAG: DUF2334 domain-containing protein [Dehalococcoidia bacterium]|nr:DUF2334 domain-containing protein [Dehalococcoidia bacterium]